MSLAEPTGGGWIAKVLLAGLEWAMVRKNPEISESELAQIARVVVIGKGNNVTIGGLDEGQAGPEVDFNLIVSRCFDAVLDQPGLSVVYAICRGGERSIRIENLGEYSLPMEHEIRSYTIAPRGEGRQRNSSTLPPPDAATQGVNLKGQNRTGSSDDPGGTAEWTARDYAEYTQRLMDLPDNSDVPPSPQGESR